MSKGKAALSQAARLLFFLFYVGWTYILKGSLFIKAVSQ